MKNRTLKLVACLVFQTAGWMCLFADFHGNLPIAAGCLALGNFFSFRRSYLVTIQVKGWMLEKQA
jgi:hypothetical protein